MLPTRFFHPGVQPREPVVVVHVLRDVRLIFLLAQFFQSVRGYSPLEAGLRSSLDGDRCSGADRRRALDRVGGGRIMGLGLTLQAIGLGWMAASPRPLSTRRSWAPSSCPASAWPSSSRRWPTWTLARPTRRGGPGSGANNAIRELGGVFGVAVLAPSSRASAARDSADLRGRPRAGCLGRRGTRRRRCRGRADDSCHASRADAAPRIAQALEEAPSYESPLNDVAGKREGVQA